ncbi:MAG: peptidylprolyl isomerase, partial [Myxococcaceae bacterium]
TGASCPALDALAGLTRRLERLEAGDVAGGGQPLLALAQQGLPASGRALLVTLRGRIVSASRTAAGTLKDDLANLDCRLAAALDRQSGQLEEVLSCGSGLIPEPQRLALGLGEIARTPPANPEQRVRQVLGYLSYDDRRVRSAAIEVLGEAQSPSAAEHLRPFIDGEDLPLAVGAADAAGRTGDRASGPAILRLASKVVHSPEFAAPVADALASLEAKDAEPALRAWLALPHPNLRMAAANALTKLTGKPVEVPHVEWPEPPFRRPHLPTTGNLWVRTGKGDIEVKLFRDEAPLTSANLWSLAEQGFFRDLTFHRVVPDFVAQGGDPRGDGQGGPGYVIPCEINRSRYVRGVVGMALSGPDTGGSQFFFTHSPQPHLDGRYTAFGEVVTGLDVVDRLLEGDRILEIRPAY